MTDQRAQARFPCSDSCGNGRSDNNQFGADTFGRDRLSGRGRGNPIVAKRLQLGGNLGMQRMGREDHALAFQGRFQNLGPVAHRAAQVRDHQCRRKRRVATKQGLEDLDVFFV